MKRLTKLARKFGGRSLVFTLTLLTSSVAVGHYTKIFTPHLCDPLQGAINNNHLGLMKLLIFIGADADAVCETNIRGDRISWGQRPIDVAAQLGNDRAIEILLDNGAKLSNAPPGGTNTLAAAAANGHLSTVNLLLSKGAKVYVREKDTDRCDDSLMGAATEGRLDVLDKILQEGAGQNGCIDVAAWEAANERQPQPLRFLISKGANVNYVNKNYSYGVTSLDIALEQQLDLDFERTHRSWDVSSDQKNLNEILEILKQAGAKETEVGRYFLKQRGK